MASFPCFRIDCRGVGYTVGFTDILSACSFSALPGECIGLLGPSGAGKSTLLKTAVGYYEATAGSVQFNGQGLAEVYDQIKASLGYVPQDDLVHPSLTPNSELTFAAQLRMPAETSQQAIEKRVLQVLRLMDLHERSETSISSLSGGQRKRVSIGCELLTEPPVLFLDEPTSGLDPALEERMMHLFRSLADGGRTVVLTTHIMETLEALDFVLLLHRGRLCFFGPPAQAMEYFKVSTFTDVYKRLEAKPPREWEQAFRASSLYGEYITRRLSASPTGDELWHGFQKWQAAREQAKEERDQPPADVVPATTTADQSAAGANQSAPATSQTAAGTNQTAASAEQPASPQAPAESDDQSLEDELAALRREIGK